LTPTAFVIGHPIYHSRSPLIHRHWLKTLRLRGNYEPVQVAPDRLNDFLARVRAGEFVGGNVTLPHKQAVLGACDQLDVAARTIGAVNTVVDNNGVLLGSNTDLYGFLSNLDQNSPGWAKNRGGAIVLGAGGAARAVVVALKERRFEPVILLNRTLERAEALASELGPGLLAAELAAFSHHAASAAIVVNTSAVGMHGTRFDGLDLALLPEDALVTDIVYTPLQTPLLADARARGLKTVDGLGMLLHQAVPGFAAWFGVRPTVTDTLRELVITDLQPPGKSPST
jgi:shikimate dehydrogenase